VRYAIDTNVLAYAEGVDDAVRQDRAKRLLATLPEEEGALPAQAAGELFNVLVRKARRTPQAAREAVLSWCDAYAVLDTSERVMASAMDLAGDHGLRIWDSVILCAAAEGGCRLLLSEDFQEGFTWRGVTVANPFAPRRHPLLEALLSSDRSAR
jgi:predicted nucleic acid-binding protein